MNEEIWKDVVGYEGYFEVSNMGNVRYLKRYNKKCEPKLMKKWTRSKYPTVTFNIKKNGDKRSIHRLVAESFLPNPENKKCVNHKNGIKSDNRVENLEWCTYAENTAHAIATGLSKNKSGTESLSYKGDIFAYKNGLLVYILKGKKSMDELGLYYRSVLAVVNKICRTYRGLIFIRPSDYKGNISEFLEFPFTQGELF
jgi:hypothetical protein